MVSTQGRGDEAALVAALEYDCIALVGSKRKARALKTALAARGIDPARLTNLKTRAGLDLGAIAPEEIALSILAEIVHRRSGQPRGDATVE
jgi:xanthine dehydrogenase accessory factor